MTRLLSMTLVLAVATMLITVGPALASDETKFKSLVLKAAPQEATFQKFDPKVLCVCGPGTLGASGFLLSSPATNFPFTVRCVIPFFDANGDYIGFGACSAPYIVANK